jgi:hypothetical protein
MFLDGGDNVFDAIGNIFKADSKLNLQRLALWIEDDGQRIRRSAGINIPILRRIWIRFQGASMGAYLLYVPMDATRKTDSKTS